MRRKSTFRILKYTATITLTLLSIVLHIAGQNLSNQYYSLEQSYLDQIEESSKAEEEDEGPPRFKNITFLERIRRISVTNISLQCPIQDNNLPHNITWLLDNAQIKLALGQVTYDEFGIELTDMISSDSGSYKCVVCNSFGCIEHTTLIIIDGRVRTSYLNNVTAFTNSNATLKCSVASARPFHGSANIWFKYVRKYKPLENIEYLSSDIHYDRLSEVLVLLENDLLKPTILTLTNVSHEDEGWYICETYEPPRYILAASYLKVVDGVPQEDIAQTGHSGWFSKAAIAVMILILMSTIGTVMYFVFNRKYRKTERQNLKTVYQWTKKVIIIAPATGDDSGVLQIPVVKIEKQRIPLSDSLNESLTIGYSEYDYPVDTNWEIPRSKLSLGSILGEGCFGRVVMGWASALHGTATTEVAVKMVKDDYTDSDIAGLVREMELMKIIGKHINIINLLGCCSKNGPLWVIVEFARYGNLKDFLIDKRPLDLSKETDLTEKHLKSFALQIAQGMEYLASRRCVHRDLAARNVLVSDDFIMKIADFGLARDIQDKDYYRKNTSGRLPIKWMAPESMKEQFYNSQSDVWSYGVLLWEIMTYGEQPYADIMSANELFTFLLMGKRMAMPAGCSHKMYMLMKQCWHINADARPTFTEIVDNLKEIIQLSSITPNARYANLPMPEITISLPSSDEEAEDVSYTPMFGYIKEFATK